MVHMCVVLHYATHGWDKHGSYVCCSTLCYTWPGQTWFICVLFYIVLHMAGTNMVHMCVVLHCSTHGGDKHGSYVCCSTLFYTWRGQTWFICVLFYIVLHVAGTNMVHMCVVLHCSTRGGDKHGSYVCCSTLFYTWRDKHGSYVCCSTLLYTWRGQTWFICVLFYIVLHVAGQTWFICVLFYIVLHMAGTNMIHMCVEAHIVHDM